MPKPNAMLARIEAAAKARYQARLHTSMDMLLQLGQDAAAIATHVVFQLGPGGAEQFFVAYREAINDMARRVVDSEQKNDFGKTVWPKFEVTNEVTDEINRKKSSVFKGFRRQGVKNTASRPPIGLPSSPSADSSIALSKIPPQQCGGIFSCTPAAPAQRSGTCLHALRVLLYPTTANFDRRFLCRQRIYWIAVRTSCVRKRRWKFSMRSITNSWPTSKASLRRSKPPCAAT